MERGTICQPVGDSRLFKIPSLSRKAIKEVTYELKVMCIDGHFVADGEPLECAVWAYAMVMMERDMREKKEKEEAAKEVEALEKNLIRPLGELLSEHMVENVVEMKDKHRGRKKGGDEEK